MLVKILVMLNKTIQPSEPRVHILMDIKFTPPTKKVTPVTKQNIIITLSLRIPNLPPGEQGPVLVTKGQSFLSICHFDLRDSDYIREHQHNSDLRASGTAPLDPNTRVIEFNAVGIGGKNLK